MPAHPTIDLAFSLLQESKCVMDVIGQGRAVKWRCKSIIFWQDYAFELPQNY